ncbi:MAG: hypothetical protein Q7T10_19760 [Rhodoferax sp.]|uniref:hypothetical protein n=1 Tax=Rhodoferax sp. TaxID=50421 RepID=UPI00271D1B97|nr:hypothetical protein [Rhodoferax sp.]MDO8451035.1 hypothetical protein [Rhodoferax sp.]
MNDTKPLPSKVNLGVTHVLADLLERLEHSTVPVGPEQYRSVVMHLVNEFGDVPSGAALGALLDNYPAAAELYENVNYEVAGLCRSSLELSLAAERQAKAVIERAMRQPK